MPIERKRTSRLRNREVLRGTSLVDWVAAVDLLGAEPGEDHAVDRQQAVESLVLLGVVLDHAHERAISWRRPADVGVRTAELSRQRR